MQPSGTILTGLRKYRNRSHAPIILDYGVINDWFGLDQKTAAFANYEHFEVRPVTRAVLYNVAENKLSERPRILSTDDFAVWAHPKHGSIVCTESDYVFAKTIAAITGRSREAVHSIHSTVTHHFKRLFLMGGPAL